VTALVHDRRTAAIEQIYIVRRLFYAATAVLVIIAVTTLIVFIEQGQRRIPVQYAKRITGRRVYGGGSTFLPVKVNQAGVVPVIFASSLLEVPQLAVSMFGNQRHPQGWVTWIDRRRVAGAVSLVVVCAGIGVPLGLSGPSGKPPLKA
jgi:preprotein translocase subunit SecY